MPCLADVLTTLGYVAALPPFSLDPMAYHPASAYRGQVVGIDAESETLSTSPNFDFEPNRPDLAFQWLTGLLASKPSDLAGTLKIRENGRVLGHRNFEFQLDSGVPSLSLNYVYVDPPARGRHLRDLLDGTLFGATLYFAATQEFPFVNLTYRQVQNPNNEARYIAAEFEAVETQSPNYEPDSPDSEDTFGTLAGLVPSTSWESIQHQAHTPPSYRRAYPTIELHRRLSL